MNDVEMESFLTKRNPFYLNTDFVEIKPQLLFAVT